MLVLMIRKGQIVQKDHIGAKIEYTGRRMSLVVFLNAHCSGTDATARGKRFQYLTTLHAKLFRLLRVAPV